MQALTQSRLVKLQSMGTKANDVPAKSSQSQPDTKTVGTRFLAILLTCLSAWGT